MSWSLHRMCLGFVAVNVEHLASHRYMYVVENGINIDKAMSESSEYRAYIYNIKPKIQKNCYLRTFPLDFYCMKDLLVVLQLQHAKTLVISVWKGLRIKAFCSSCAMFSVEKNEQALHIATPDGLKL